MAKETPIINIFTYGLPYKLANQIYKEYESRLREAVFIITESKRYEILKDSMKTVELLLALSIFDKRVISNLQAGVKFYSTVSSYSESETIQIGAYKLTGDEKNKLLGVIINYNNILDNYGLSNGLTNYSVTKDFLLYLVNLKKAEYYG
ncbi:hypothetical protein [Polaribacter sp. Q13]|uniref:hypothetical protein n=1 Tax=Polaribacter sp. Q13 TaxID=2806551 RepID=UPI00193C7FC7|nr:hypothetical protein [Polaribacter sp. Q13]QVY66883.1 hypothetical protein JOP69_06260 [Polaribacter sp. Q13]